MPLKESSDEVDADWGEKLAEGIYILNRKKKATPPEDTLMMYGNDYRLYPDQIKKLRENISLLLKTNTELQTELTKDPEEVEYSLAIRENKEVIKRFESDIEKMENDLISRGYAGMVDKIDPVNVSKKCTMHLLEDEEEYPEIAADQKESEEAEEEPQELVL
eukprot:TRINITY_DN430_c4_g1_i1.p1 TRINITY_DN430_c4_g1~~TRINITY_DN430_c4_g1_i1.p1  ORF type:complete len:180 (+),score=48.14 TRINITY_DN430_c4_g1_i1:57-542(+)